MHRRTLPLLPLAGLALLAQGCMHETNERLVLGEDLMLPAFAEHPDEITPDNPSIVGLDRGNWEPIVYEIPVNGVAHSPQYAPPTFDLDTLPRQRGEQPTELTALELGEPDGGAEIAQMFQSHGLAVLDAVILVPRLFVRPPDATNWSPRVSYERAPASAITAPWCVECGGPCIDGCAPADLGAEPVVEPTPSETAPAETVPGEPTPDEPPAVEETGGGAGAE